MKNFTSLTQFPDEILLEILSWLDPEELAHLREVNKHIKDLLDKTDPTVINKLGLQQAAHVYPQLKIRYGQIQFFKRSLHSETPFGRKLTTVIDTLSDLIVKGANGLWLFSML